MQEKIKQIKEIANFLSNADYNSTFDNMVNSLNRKEYMVSVMGQFSAGKSKFINNLLGKNVLPVHITETTAVVTLIKFGEQEYAEITYDDGNEKNISIEESLKLWQSGDKNNLENVTAITIYVNSELLINGLIIADTPGVNTVIEKHIQITTQILDNSDKVIYVLGKSVSNSDLNFIEKIKKCGINLLFVRTHMDEIKISEESLEEAINKEKKTLELFSQEEIFFISNEQGNSFYDNVKKIWSYLNNTLAQNVTASLEKSCELKLCLIAKDLNQELLQQKLSFQKLVDGKMSEYNEDKNKIYAAMAELDKLMGKRTERIKQSCNEAENEARETILVIVSKSEKKLNEKLSQIKEGSEIDVFEEKTKACISESYQEMQRRYLSCVEKIVGDNRDELRDVLQSNCGDFKFDSFIPDSIDETEEQLIALKTAENKRREFEMEMEAIDKSIENINNSNQQITDNLNEISENKKLIEQTLREFPQYEARYKVVQEASNRYSAIFGRIGSALDWGTIIIPGKAITTVTGKLAIGTAKVLKKVGASANTVKKVEKFGRMLQKSKKATDIANKFDKGVDTAKSAKKFLSEGLDNSLVNPDLNDESTTILDYLTFEYWFRKFGKRFDQERIVEVDKEYENQYNLEKSKIEKQIQNSVQEEMKKREQILKNSSQIQKEEMRKNILKAKTEEANREIATLKKKFENEKIREVHQQMCDYYVSMGVESIKELSEELSETMHEKLPEYIELYISTENVSIMQKLANQKNKLDKLEASFSSKAQDDIDNTLEKYNNFTGILQNYVNS